VVGRGDTLAVKVAKWTLRGLLGRSILSVPSSEQLMHAHSYVAVLLLAVALACSPPDTSANAKQAIDAANAQWPRLTSTGHADSIAEFYAVDAALMPPNLATVHGKDAVRAFFATMNTIDPHPTLTLHAVTVVASGPGAVETGRWNWAFPAGAKLPPGMAAVDSGKYIVRWAQQNGRWLMVDDIWNSDTPLPTAPPPPPAPARRGR
jgi:ketosteroid isomerase-like protein